jgi:hypothetical protein
VSGRRFPQAQITTTARRKALERELALTGTPSLSKAQPKPKPLPGFTRIRDAADKYIDGLWAEGNLVPRTMISIL